MTQRESWTWRHAILKSDLPPTTRHVLLTLSCHISDAGDACCPSINELVAETGLSKRAVIDHLKAAEISAWISVSQHGFKGQKWARNEYRINVPGTVARPASLPEGGERGAPPLMEGGAPRSLGGSAPGSLPNIKEESSPYSPPKAGDECAGFSRFWAAWPEGRKVARGQCERHWRRHNLERCADEVIKGVEAWRLSKRWQEGFVPNPMTFLNQGRWQRESWPPEALAKREQKGGGCCVCGATWTVEIKGRRYCSAHHPERQGVTT